MYKQLYTRPLTPKTPDIRCGHNGFTHHVFPRFVHKAGLKVLDEIEVSPASAQAVLLGAFKETNTTYPLSDDHPNLALRDISVSLDAVGPHPLIVLSLIPPTAQIGTHFVGLLRLVDDTIREGGGLRYMTLERSTARRTALCEWAASVDGFQHRYLREGPKPQAGLFACSIGDLLEFEAL